MWTGLLWLFASWGEIILTAGHVDTGISLTSANFGTSGYSAAPTQASGVNCYFKGHPHRGCPVNWGQCLLTSPARLCPNIPPKDVKFARRHPRAWFLGFISLRGPWQKFLVLQQRAPVWRLKRLRYLDAVARQHLSLLFSCQLLWFWFCPERFLHVNPWESGSISRRRRQAPSIISVFFSTPTALPVRRFMMFCKTLLQEWNQTKGELSVPDETETLSVRAGVSCLGGHGRNLYCICRCLDDQCKCAVASRREDGDVEHYIMLHHERML